MTMLKPISLPALPAAGRADQVAVRDFMRRWGDDLTSAARTVGGETEARRTARLLSRLRSAAVLRSEDRAALVRLHRLLMLDAEPAEPAWMMRHPDEPAVHAVCLCADALRALLERLSKAEDRTGA
jgi:hypothetical protein